MFLGLFASQWRFRIQIQYSKNRFLERHNYQKFYFQGQEVQDSIEHIHSLFRVKLELLEKLEGVIMVTSLFTGITSDLITL